MGAAAAGNDSTCGTREEKEMSDQTVLVSSYLVAYLLDLFKLLVSTDVLVQVIPVVFLRFRRGKPATGLYKLLPTTTTTSSSSSFITWPHLIVIVTRFNSQWGSGKGKKMTGGPCNIWNFL